MQKEINVKSCGIGMFNEEIIDAIFDERGIKDRERFMNPTEESLLPLDALENINEAAGSVIYGIMNRKNFMVYYDCDTDGISAGTIMTRYLGDHGINARIYINSGKVHGVTEESLKYMYGIDILIIVDSLNADVEFYKAIKEMGIQTLVLDHHDIDVNIPYDDYVTLVSSNRNYGNSELSGAGVTFKFCLYLDELMDTDYAQQYWDLSCCGILSDVMSVDERHMENRYIVKKGLENPNNPAIKKIIGTYEFNSTAVLFSVAPLINASMRYNENQVALDLFLSDDNKEILKNLRVLKKCKEKQAEEVNEILPDLIEQAENQKDRNFLFLVIETENGISGLLATRMAEMYSKPAIVVKETRTAYMGSLRAEGCDFRALCESTGYGEFNGHPQAAGVYIDYGNADKFVKAIDKLLEDVEFKKEIDVDIELNVGDINEDLIKEIKKIDFISGNGFKPVSVLIRCDEYEPGTMSQGKHLVLSVGTYWRFQFIKWNTGDRLEEFEDHELCGDELSFIGTLDSGFLGRNYSLRMIVDDIIED